jgi:hypothetical protein
MKEDFIGEQIKPIKGTFDTHAMAKGEPGLPKRFIWRDKEYEVQTLLEKWKEASGRKKGGEIYVRKHWYRVETTNGYIMKIYFERKAKSKTQWKTRWWLYSIKQGGFSVR